VQPIGACLPVKGIDRPADIRRLAAQVLAASAQILSLDVESIRSANPWLSAQDISFFLEAALGISDIQEPAAPKDFVLPGRPALETVFREHVIEPTADRARYEGLRLENGAPNIFKNLLNFVI
jgi:cell division protease FtsH